jgi:hypothetical protein
VAKGLCNKLRQAARSNADRQILSARELLLARRDDLMTKIALARSLAGGPLPLVNKARVLLTRFWSGQLGIRAKSCCARLLARERRQVPLRGHFAENLPPKTVASRYWQQQKLAKIKERLFLSRHAIASPISRMV